MQTSKKRKYYYQPSIGVKVDFETLLQRFSSAGTVRYQKFAELWKEMKMSLYCAGRQTQREAREFVEECFHIAVQFWLPPSSFLVRAGALYLLYGLYYFQLVSPRAKIRITNEDWKTILEFHREARAQQHLDLDYIFQKLLVGKAFQFVATQTELYPSFRDKEDHELIIPDILKEESNVVGEIFSDASLGQLELVHEQYQKMKVALNGEGEDKPDSSLDIIHSDIIQGVQKIVQTHRWRQNSTRYVKELTDDHIAGHHDLEKQEIQETSTKKSLKRKAYKTSLGYFKTSKRGQGKSNEDTGDSTDSDLLSPERKRDGRGRQQFVELYDKDETELDPMEPTLSAVYSMPDLDLIIPPNPLVSADNTQDTAETPSSAGKGKRLVSGKGRPKKGQKASKRTLENDSVNDNTNRRSKDSDKKQKNTGKGSKKKLVKVEKGSGEICSPKKRIKTEVPSDEYAKSEVKKKSNKSKGQIRPQTGKGQKKKPQKEKAGEKTTNKKTTEKIKELTEDEKGKKKKPTAQEILFQSLKARKKKKVTKKKKK